MNSARLAALLIAAAAPALAAPFAARITANDPVRLWIFPDPALEAVGTIREVDGPLPSAYPAFPDQRKAAAFDRAGYYRLPDSGSNPDLQFTNGETITIETWLRCDKISGGQFQYIIGKGRTHREGFAPDNQNWALRLAGQGGQARVSFLFRSAPDGDSPGAYHRWTSKLGISPGARWHHLALTYTFGSPKSIVAWVDGHKCGGGWDKEGPTTAPPVVDEDEVWIGSALGGSTQSSLDGALACLALYRHPVSGFEAAYEAMRYTHPLDLAAIPPGRVQVEVFRSDSGPRDWPLQVEAPLRTLDAEAFGLFRLPPTYGPDGQRLEQSGVYLVRLAAMVELPAGESELTLRAPGLARLTIDHEEILALPPAEIVRDAHGPLRTITELRHPFPRLGTREEQIVCQSTSQPMLIVIEALLGDQTLLGDPGGKIQVGELLLSMQGTGRSDESLVAPVAAVPFTTEGIEHYQERERAHHDQLDTALRRRLAGAAESQWEERHAHAKAYITALPPIDLPAAVSGQPAGNVIDRFLLARLNAARDTAEEPPSAFQRTVHPLLEEHCFRCHGEKAKGGLRLNSREAILKGGESGPALDPDHPATSELLHRVRSKDKEERMPPKGDRLTDADVAALTTWIAQGAPWDDLVTPVTIPPDLDDHAFLRRLYLDTVGVFPTPQEIAAYLADSSPDRTARLIDRLLDDPRHADHWVGYWQDVLAENPRLVKPSLNNTGPFRYWIHEALLDHKPLDRFVTELVSFAGGTYSGAAGGFKLATGNDAPMAAKAHVLGTAFLGLELKCARCHDAPFHSLTQEDLFSLAAMLKGEALKVPTTSTVPATFFDKLGDREPRIAVTLNPDTPVQPAWPFDELAPVTDSDPSFRTPAERLAYQITRPENRRFAQVMVNRLWKRYFGQGFVEPADDWEGAEPSHPGLLDWLAREFVSNNYDLRHLSRLILNSAAYRRAPRQTAAASASSRFFEAPQRRRLSAEQLVDSLFAATGTPVFAEELTLDVEGWYPDHNFLNFGRPRRAWEFVSLSTERDRPSLTLPHAQSIVSFLEAYGWRSNRTEPLTDRPANPDVRQAGLLANGLLGVWWSRLSDFSDLTALAIEADTPAELIEALFLRLLTRRPTDTERAALLDFLTPDFDSRRAAPPSAFHQQTYTPAVRHISWRNHLDPDSNLLAAEIERKAAQGPPPTDFLSPAWRSRFEDVVWSLLNSPEMQYVP